MLKISARGSEASTLTPRATGPGMSSMREGNGVPSRGIGNGWEELEGMPWEGWGLHRVPLGRAGKTEAECKWEDSPEKGSQ